MIKIFYGTDRKRLMAEIRRFLGTEAYQEFEGESLTAADYPNMFMGRSLFDTGDERAILIRDALAGENAAEIAKYLETPYKVALFETAIDRTGAGWKALEKKVEKVKYDLAEVDTRTMFDVFRTAKRDGARAVEMLRGIRDGLEPKAFVGVMASQAFKDYGQRARARERKVLREMAKLDMDLGKVLSSEATAERGWTLVEGFLMRVSKI